VSTDGQVTFSWAAATCPTGYTVASYAYTITGGKDGNNQTSGTLKPEARSVTVQIDAVGKAAALTYTVTCGNLAASAASETATSDPWQPSDEQSPLPGSTETPQDPL
jgi:serine/threonine-protein kinase